MTIPLRIAPNGNGYMGLIRFRNNAPGAALALVHIYPEGDKSCQ